MIWPSPTPLFCDHCGLPVISQRHGLYQHVGGWLGCCFANWPNWTGDPDAMVTVDGYCRMSTSRGA